MKYPVTMLVILVALLVFSFAITHRKGDRPAVGTFEQTVEAATASGAPVIVELFTSEGCSSCPPADQVLAQLDREQPVQGAMVIALSEHVDYWNYIGWTDPYSSSAYSTRQNRYAEVFGRDQIYTPQMVVDGQAEFVGSSMDRARNAISKAAQSPKATVQISRALQPAGSDKVQLKVHVENMPAVKDGNGVEVMLAVTENNLRSSVQRGENAGRKLAHSAVTRSLTTIGQIASGKNNFDAEPVISLAKEWKPTDLRAVIFLQERTSRRIIGAGQISLAKE